MAINNPARFYRSACTGLVFLFFYQFLCGQPRLHIEKVEADGLTNYYIKCITQDNIGFLWFGTEEGLFRYDGYSFGAIKNFPGDPHTICNNNIEFLQADKDSLLWIGSRGGLSCINSKNLQVENFPSKQTFTVYSIAAGNADFFYVGTSAGLYQFFKKNRTWKRVTEFPENIFIRSLSPDNNGNLFITSHQGIYKYNTRTKLYQRFSLPDAPEQKGLTLQIAHRSLIAKDGNVLVTTWNAGLLKLDQNSGTCTAFLPPNLDKSLKEFRGCYDLLEAADGDIWMANSENGITILDTAHNSIASYPVQWDAEKNIPVRVYALYRDKSGILWIGTENGIYKSDPHSAHFTTINFSPTKGTKPLRPDLSTLSSLKDSDGDWWIGSYDGLFLLDPLTGSLDDYSARAGLLKGFNVFNIIQESPGVIWVTNVNRLIRLTKNKINGRITFVSKAYECPELTSNITTAKLDSRKRLWLGTFSNGIFMFDPVAQSFTSYPGGDSTIAVNKNEIRLLYELPDESILVGGDHIGLVKLYPALHRFEKATLFSAMKDGNDFTANAIARDKDGNLWIGTDGNGLWRTDNQLKNFRQYTIRDGFPSMNITAVMPDENDHLWIVSEGGVIDYRPQQKKLTLFDKGAGIRNLYNLSFISKMENGAVAIGDVGCVHLYNPSEVTKNLSPPKVIISGFKIFDQSYPFPGDETVKLNYNQNYFSFDYIALDYTRPSHNKYSYMLEGVDLKWNDAGTRRYVSYTNLEEGDYIFKVKACNSEGIWNESPATLHLIIRPPFWHRWWFYALTLLTAALLLYLVYFIKRRQLISKEQLRNKIARDLHDDIGSTLSGINIFSKLALQKLTTDRYASGELLKRINTRTEKTMEALSDIVWSINTKKDNMDNVVARMREYLGEVIEPLGIQYDFLIDTGMGNVHIDMEIRKEVYLIFKEAVHNVSKYASCSFLQIQLKKENKFVLLLVKDNGKGFDINTIIPGNGINNMQERAEKIHGSFEISSSAGKGTSIRLLFPVT